jgi:hypothetical protein
MDLSNNEFDNIRAPDKAKREQLMEDNRSEFDKQMEEALYLSSQEIKNLEEFNKKYEEDIINNYYIENVRRKTLFHDLLLDLNKIIKFDKDVKDVYKIIEPIVESYCSQQFDFTEIDSLTYDKIFKVIGTIRTNKNSVELLKTILIRK